MSTIPRVGDRAGMPSPDFDRLSASLAGLATMGRALAWFASHRPPLVPEGVVTQDAFSVDILVPYRDGLHLVFDST